MSTDKYEMTEKDFDDFDDDEFGWYEGQCVGCDGYSRIDDVGLCKECAGKLERDLIRQRDWDYSALAFGCPESKREELRKEIIARYGEKLELIAPKKEPPRQRKKKRHKGGRKTRGRSR